MSCRLYMTYRPDRDEMRYPTILTLGKDTVVRVGSDSGLIDFEETRFRAKAIPFQETLRPLANSIAKELGSRVIGLEELAQEEENQLKSHTYCVFDLMAMKSSKKSGFLRVQWIPLAVFSGGERKLSLHALYDSSGASLKTMTMVRDGKDERTSCTTIGAASKVSMSYLRTYILSDKR